MKDSMGIEVPAIMGKLYPNGEYVVWKPRVSKESPLSDMPIVPGVIDYIGALIDAEMPEGDFASERVSVLGLSYDPILNPLEEGGSKPRAVKGLGGITSFGRRMLRNGCWLLEDKYSKDRLSFLTLTLPSFSIDQGRVIQTEWSAVMQNFKNAFAKACKKQGLPLEYVYCVEIQELRSRGAGWPVLHVHMVFVGKRRKNGAWRIRPEEIDRMWKKALESVLRAAVDVKAACRVEPIRVSAESYLSKYISKGCSSLDEWKAEGLSDFFPSHWWGMSASLRCQVRARLYYSPLVGQTLEELSKNDNNLSFKREIMIEWGGALIQVGQYGRLKPQVAEELKDFLDKQDDLFQSVL